MSSIQDTLTAAAIVINSNPELYHDALQPTVQEVGKMVSRIPQAINAAFAPLDNWIAKKEFTIERTKALLAKELENVDPKKIVPPESYIAIPAVQAISYSMDCEVLREMYAKLLSKSIHQDYKESVHPAFVDILKQMSPLDCQILSFIFNYQPSHQIGSIDFGLRNANGESELQKNFISYDTATECSQYKISASIDNLVRLGLITVIEGFKMHTESIYNEIKATYNYQLIYKFYQESLNEESFITTRKNTIKPTDFGNLLHHICIDTINESQTTFQIF